MKAGSLTPTARMRSGQLEIPGHAKPFPALGTDQGWPPGCGATAPLVLGGLPRHTTALLAQGYPPPPQGFFRTIKNQGGGDPSPKTPSPPPQTKVTIVGKNEIYNRENLVRPFLVHQVLGPKPPPPLPPPAQKKPCPPPPPHVPPKSAHAPLCQIPHSPSPCASNEQGTLGAQRKKCIWVISPPYTEKGKYLGCVFCESQLPRNVPRPPFVIKRQNNIKHAR